MAGLEPVVVLVGLRYALIAGLGGLRTIGAGGLRR